MRKTAKPTAKTAALRKTEAGFAVLVNTFGHDRQVTCGGKGFGSTALKVNGKIFAMLSSKGQFVVKLPKERVDELVKSGRGAYFEPARGRRMKEWLTVKLPQSRALKLAGEACEFVRRGAPRESRPR